MVYSIIFQLMVPEAGEFYFATLSAAVNIFGYIAGAFHVRKIDAAESKKICHSCTTHVYHPKCYVCFYSFHLPFTYLLLHFVMFTLLLSLVRGHISAPFSTHVSMKMDILCLSIFLMVLSPLNTLRAAVIKNSILKSRN